MSSFNIPQHTSPQCRVCSLATRLLIHFRANTACQQADPVANVGHSLSGKSLSEGRLGVERPDRPDLPSLM